MMMLSFTTVDMGSTAPIHELDAILRYVDYLYQPIHSRLLARSVLSSVH